MGKIRMLVLAGGQSDEHEISIISAQSLLNALAGSNIDATPIVITREGRWLTLPESKKALSAGYAKKGGELALHQAQLTEGFDVVFPLLHGPQGEDGTVQGMLELAGLPYVGSGVLSSALCMDKPMAKDVLAAHGIPQVRWIVATRYECANDLKAVLARARELTSPWFVKPANLGSSVGISRVEDEKDLPAAFHAALKFDRRLIVEEAVVDARELEMGVVGNDEPEASPVGEIIHGSAFYDYETKYTDGRAELIIPADVPEHVHSRIRDLGVKAFRLLDCAGFARIDFFYQPASAQVLLNEVNTIPGFTPLSMFTKLWEAAALPYPDLVKKLVDLALERHSAKGKG